MNTQQKDPKDSHVCLALIDGEILEYGTADLRQDYDPNKGSDGRWEYLGEGMIWSANGFRQTGSTRLHFWARAGVSTE